MKTAPCDVLTNSVETSIIEESDSDITESGSGHVAVNKNYVSSDSDGTESGSRHVEIKVNGIDKSDVIESGPCRVKIETDDVGQSDVFDSGSVRVNVKKISVNKCKEDGKAAVKLCKKTYIKSNAVSIQAKGRSEVVKDGPVTSQCADGEHRLINNSSTDSDGTALERVEVRRESVGRTVRSAAVIRPAVAASPSDKSSESRSSSANDRVSSTLDGLLSANADNVNTQTALSSPSSDKTKHRDDLSVRTPNKENTADKSHVVESGSGRVKVETDDVVDSGSVRVNVKKTKHRDDLAVSTANRVSAADGKIIEQQMANHRLMLRDLPTVHKEGNETDRPLPLSNCRLISTKLTSDRSPAVHNEGVETDRQRQHANCPLPTVCNNSGEADQHTNCRLTSDNLPKTCSMGVETDRSTNRQVLSVYSESGETGQHRQIDSALSKGGEIDRHVNCQLPAVHKCHMLVDCDVNLPQNVWTTVVNHNSLSSDDSTTHHAARSMPNAASEV